MRFVAFAVLGLLASVAVAEPEWVRVRVGQVQIPFHIQGEDLQVLNAVGRVLNQDLSSFEVSESPEALLMVRGERLSVAGRRVPGPLILVPSQKRRYLDLLAEINFSDYLVGVLSEEVPSSWPEETLRAQALAIKSYTLSKMQGRLNDSFQLDSSVQDQAFELLDVAVHPEKYQRLRKIVESLKGLLLADASGEVVQAFYHADCGGTTVDAKSVWGSSSPKTVVVDQGCEVGAHWSYRISSRDLQRRLKPLLRTRSRVIRWQVLGTRLNPRNFALQAEFADGSTQRLSINTVREALGYQNLQSAQFTLSYGKEPLTFEGQGRGHGVGLCQMGAKRLGLAGWDFRKILSFYYPHTRVAEEKTLISSQTLKKLQKSAQQKQSLLQRLKL